MAQLVTMYVQLSSLCLSWLSYFMLQVRALLLSPQLALEGDIFVVCSIVTETFMHWIIPFIQTIIYCCGKETSLRIWLLKVELSRATSLNSIFDAQVARYFAKLMVDGKISAVIVTYWIQMWQFSSVGSPYNLSCLVHEVLKHSIPLLIHFCGIFGQWSMVVFIFLSNSICMMLLLGMKDFT